MRTEDEEERDRKRRLATTMDLPVFDDETDGDSQAKLADSQLSAVSDSASMDASASIGESQDSQPPMEASAAAAAAPVASTGAVFSDVVGACAD